MAKGIAITKRLKISRAQQETFIAVLIASLVVGVGAVLSIYFIKYIAFNSKVIDAKNDAITAYETTLKNVKSLRNNVLDNMASNEDLEAVARDSLTDCYDQISGEKITYSEWNEQYEKAETQEAKDYYFGMLKICSALRVIPDALPAQKNDEALLASLNQIFIISKWNPESLSPNGTITESKIDGLGVIPVSLSVETDSNTTLKVLNNIERSIREFDIATATIEWSGSDRLSLKAQAAAYYTQESGVKETTKTVYASNAAKKKGNK